MNLDAARYRLSEDKHQAIFERKIQPRVFKGVTASDRPTAIVFGGQPGAGKSAAVEAAVFELQSAGGAAEIIGDDFRAMHPMYRRLLASDDKTAAFYTDRDTGAWIEKSIAFALRSRLNIVIEGTMRDGAKVAQTLTDLRGAGYRVEARALAVNDRLSWQGILQRYEAQKADRGFGRMTAEHSHRDAYNGMPLTLEHIEREKLADRVVLYRRGAEVVYSNELREGRWLSPPAVRQALEAERQRPMSLAERIAYAEGFDQLAERLVRPGRNATPAEIQTLDVLRTQAHKGVLAEVLRTHGREALARHPSLAPSYDILDAVRVEAEKRRDVGPGHVADIVQVARLQLAAGIEGIELGTVSIQRSALHGGPIKAVPHKGEERGR